MSDHSYDQPWGGDHGHQGEHHEHDGQHGEHAQRDADEHAQDDQQPNQFEVPPPPAWATGQQAGDEPREPEAGDAGDVDELPVTLPVGRPPLDRESPSVTWKVKAPGRLDEALQGLIDREGGDRSKHVRKAVAAYLDAHR